MSILNRYWRSFRNGPWWRCRYALLCIAMALGVGAVVLLVRSASSDEDVRPLSEIVALADAGSVEKIVVTAGKLIVTLRYYGDYGESTQQVVSYTGMTISLVDVATLLEEEGIEIGGPEGVELSVPDPGFLQSFLVRFILTLLPTFFIFGLFYWVMSKQMRGLNSKIDVTKLPKVTFDDVGGFDEVKQELHEVVDFFQYPQQFADRGARVPKGVLMTGEPGTGKTLLARAVAGEAGVPFFYVAGSSFVELFVGLAAKRVRDLFAQARSQAPSIIFIDEIDAIGGHRGRGQGAGEQDQALNQILTEMDGFKPSVNPVVVIAATNRLDFLDTALTRPGRFDRTVVVPLPNLVERQAILRIHSANKPLAATVSLEEVAKATPGMSGASLANMLNEAAILATRRSLASVSMLEIDEAVEKVLIGTERRSKTFSQQTLKVIAYHEAGHALVARKFPSLGSVRTISIVPRGESGGHTTIVPLDEDQELMTQSQLKDALVEILAGRAAEDVVFGDVTVGSCSDMQVASNTVRQMIRTFGMGGTLYVGESENGDDLKEAADQLLQEAYSRSKAIIESERPLLNRVVEYLLERETVSGDAVDRLFLDAEAAVEMPEA